MKEELFRNYRELQSERLLLREITARDVSDIFEIYSDPEVMLYFDDRFAFQELPKAEASKIDIVDGDGDDGVVEARVTGGHDGFSCAASRLNPLFQ